MKLKNATIMVTGAASGLGRACMKHFLEAGGNVVGFDRAWDTSATASSTTRYIAGDVASEDDVLRAIAEAIETFGKIDAAVNCAGILRAGRVVRRDGAFSLEDFSDVVRVNLIGTFNVIRLVAQAMTNNSPNEQGERGVIVNTSSVAAFEGQIGQAAYSASKGGVASMTLPIARELGQFGIRVVAIAPGVFETAMMAATPDRVRQSLVEQIPFPHRLGQPAEFVALVEHIFENAMLNGCVLRLDGGMRMGPR